MKFLVIVVSMLVGFNAHADYFKGGLGYSIGGKAKVEANGVSDSEKLDKDFLAPIVLAYGFEMLGDVYGEAEFSYRKTGYDVDGATSEPTAMNVAFNVVGNAPVSPAATLTGGAGFTFGSYDFDANGLDNGTAFGLQLFGGVDFAVNENVKIGGELRYLTTLTKADMGNSIDGSYNNTSILVNVKFGM